MAAVAGSRPEAVLEVIFGYTATVSILSGFVGLKPEQLLPISALVGGFVSAFLYYLKPFDYLLRRRLTGSTKNHYWSPYLRPVRTSIVAGIYLSITAAIVVIVPSTVQFVDVNVRGYVVWAIVFLSLWVFAVAIARWIWLQGKAFLVETYYHLLEQSRFVEPGNPVGLLERALRDEDWHQASVLARNLGTEIPPPDKWERRLNTLLGKLRLQSKSPAK